MTKLEQIDMLRERANVTYEEAKEALESCNYDMVEALVYLERNKKIKNEGSSNCEEGYGFITAIKNLIKKGNATKFVIKKKESILLKVPVTIAAIITVIAPYITVIALVLALFTNHKLQFVNEDGNSDMEVNRVLEKVSTAVDVAKSKLTEEMSSEK